MLGFQTELKAAVLSQSEGLDTANLQKNELYDLVAATYMLPPYASKGVTREYLLKVYRNEAFRIPTRQYKEFEINLTKDQLKKVGITNNALLVKKLNMLLASKHLNTLGFADNEIPEQTWLYKIARFIDQTNILEFFEHPVQAEIPLQADGHISSKIHFGRLFACRWLFRIEQAKKSQKLWENLKAVSENYRGYISSKINAGLLEQELNQTREKMIMFEHALNDLVGKATFTYSSLENPLIKPELVIAGGEAFTKDMRDQLNTNAKLYIPIT